VKVMSSGVNPVETYTRSGTGGKASTLKLPWYPGSDAAGVVEKVGLDVKSVKEGDRVWLGDGEGSYSQYCLASEARVHLLPSKCSFDQGASLWIPYGTAFHAIQHSAQMKAGQKVLIHGASGGVGQACLQFCRNYNVEVYGTASTQEGLNIIAKEGAKPFNHKEEGYIEKLKQASGGHGFDVILEMLANVNLDKDLSILAKAGCIVVIGCRGPIEINPRMLMGTRGSIKGVQLFLITPQEEGEIINAINKGLENGSLNPTVGKAYKLTECSHAHRDIINPPSGATGKIVLHPWEL